MLTPSLQQKIIDHERSLGQTRRALQAIASEVLGGSKRAIFAFHREDAAGAKQELSNAHKRLEDGWKLIKKEPLLTSEGMWHAAREEFAEADFFAQYLDHGKITSLSDKDPDVAIGGLSDVIGEMVRRAVLLATRGEYSQAEKMYIDASDIVQMLLKMDLTGGLRTKVDQAKQHLRRLEEIRYDIAMR